MVISIAVLELKDFESKLIKVFIIEKCPAKIYSKCRYFESCILKAMQPIFI